MGNPDRPARGREKPSKKPPDEMDRRIIDLLREDSSLSTRELARKLGAMTRQAVATRLKRLRGDGVIRRHTVDLDWNQLGYHLPVLLFVRHRHETFERFGKLMEMATRAPEVHDGFSLSGSPGFCLFGLWRDNHDYSKWKKEFIKEAVDKGFEIYEMEEFVVWGFWKRRGWKLEKWEEPGEGGPAP